MLLGRKIFPFLSQILGLKQLLGLILLGLNKNFYFPNFWLNNNKNFVGPKFCVFIFLHINVKEPKKINI